MKQPEHSATYPPITAADLERFGKAARDPNRIHLDEAVARAAGLPGVIAHGMLIASYLSEQALKFGRSKLGAHYRISLFRTRFRGMTSLGARITVSGEWKSSSEGSPVLELEARDETGDLKTTGQVEWTLCE